MDYDKILVEAIKGLPEYIEKLTEVEFIYETSSTGIIIISPNKDTKLHISYIESARFIETSHSFTPAYTRDELLTVVKEAMASEINDWYLGVSDISLGQEI